MQTGPVLSRRGFLGLIAAVMAVGVDVPAMRATRKPYVIAGETVDYVGSVPGGFIGAQLVHVVDAWDGVGYPVQTWNNSYGPARALETYYDFDLANFRREVPERFWHDPAHCAKYPNVHTFLREQRFGETVAEAIKHLNFYGARFALV